MELGTILPDFKTMAVADKVADLNFNDRQRKGDKLFPNSQKRYEEGEIRYYQNPDQYAIISTRGTVLYFERRQDGYFYAKRS